MIMIHIIEKKFHDIKVIDYDFDYDNTLNFWVIIFSYSLMVMVCL